MHCPVKTSEEWKDLVATVGENDAYYAYMLNGDVIPSPFKARMIIGAYEGRELDMNDYYQSLAYKGGADNDFDNVKTIEEGPEPKMSMTKEAEIRVRELAGHFSSKYGTMVNYVTPMFAKSIFERTGEVFSDNVRGFYYNGTMYLINGRYNEETILHEMAHPFIEVLFNENRKAFDAIYGSLLNTVEGIKIANEVRSKVFYGTEEDMQKEIMVRAVSREASAEQITEQKFKDIITRIYEAIMNAINLIMGRTIIDQVNGKTTLAELTSIIYTRDYSINPQSAMVAGKIYAFEDEILKGIEEEHLTIEQIKTPDGRQAYTSTEYPGLLLKSNSEQTREMLNPEAKAMHDSNVAKADYLFEQHEISESDKISGLKKVRFNGRAYNYTDLIAEYDRMSSEKMTIGTICHLLAEKELATSVQKKRDIDTKIDEMCRSSHLDRDYHFGGYEREHPDNPGMSVMAVLLRDKLELIAPQFGNNVNAIRASDIIFSEAKSINKDLMLGTSDDIIIRRPNGSFYFVDLKFGQAFASLSDHLQQAKYADGTNISQNPFHSSCMDLAKRVFMKKVKYGEAFRISDVAFLAFTKEHMYDGEVMLADAEVKKFPLSDYLITLKRYYNSKEAEKELPGINKKAQEWEKLGYFDIANYYTFGQEISDDMVHDNKTIEEMEEYYVNQIERYTTLLESKMLPDKQQEKQYKEEIVKITRKLIELRKSPEMDAYKLYKDMSGIRAVFGSQYDASNPYAQMAMAFFRKQTDKKTKEYNKIIDEYEDLLAKVLKRSKTDKLISDIVGSNPEKVFGVLYVTKNGPDGFGRYMIDEVEDAEEFEERVKSGKMTSDHINLLNFVKKTWEEQYEKTVSYSYFQTKKYNYTRHRAYQKQKMRRIPEKLYPGFMPRVPITKGELAQQTKTKFFSKKYLTALWNDLKVTKYDDDIYVQKTDLGMSRMKYMPSKYGVESYNHTINLDRMFRDFTGNLLQIQYMDPAVAYTKGIVHLLEAYSETNDEVAIKNTVRYLDGMMKVNMLKVRNETLKIPLPWTSGTSLSVDKLTHSIVNYTGMVLLALHPAIAAFNLALIIIFSHMKAMSNSFTSLVTRTPDDKIEFTISDVLWADLQYATYVFQALTLRGKENKMSLFLDMLQFRSEPYEYRSRTDKLMVGGSKVFNRDNMYWMNQVGEDYGAFILLGAMLRHKKDEVTGKSIYDSYEVENGKLVWKGGDQNHPTKRGLRGQILRGKMPDGTPIYEDLYGLNSVEIAMMKDVTRKMNGGYREDERVAIEAYGLSRFFMQFKRYMPAYILETWGGRHIDESQETYRKTGIKDGIIIFNADKMMHAPTARTIIKAAQKVLEITRVAELFSMSRTDDFTAEEWKKLNYAAATAALMLSYLFITAAGDDDDKKKTRLQERLDRLFLEDISKMARPLDIIRNLQQPFPSITFIGKSLNQWHTFMTSVITNDRLQNGVYRGQRQALNTVPFLSTRVDIDKYLFNSPKDGVKGWGDFVEMMTSGDYRPK